MIVPTITSEVLFCSSVIVGQEDLTANSCQDSWILEIILLIFYFFARAQGFEPWSTVLETAILPLNYARM